MRIGFCGAHRVGKTTLALEIAKQLAIEFIPVSVSKSFAELGMDVKSELSRGDTWAVQRRILERYKETANYVNEFVVDRTPYDFIAYTKHRYVTGFESYDAQCYDEVNLDVVFVVQPGIKYEYAATSFDEDTIHSIHCNVLSAVMGHSLATVFSGSEKHLLNMSKANPVKAVQSPIVFVLPKTLLDLEDRVSFVKTIVQNIK